MRKSIRKCAIAALVSLCVFAGITSCSDDGDGSSGVTSWDIENYLYGKRWFFRDYFMDRDGTEYTFFRNHLLMSFSSSDKLTSGMLTYGPNYFFGTWNTAGDKLLTTFTVAPYIGLPIRNNLYGILTVTDLASDRDKVICTDSIGETHYFEHYKDYGTRKHTFTDYTDASAHDKALHGTWKMTAYKGGKIPVGITIIVSKKGNVRFIAESEGIDFTTTYTTKNGHVTFTHFLQPNSKQVSYIYIRDDESLEFFSEEIAVRETVWRKK